MLKSKGFHNLQKKYNNFYKVCDEIRLSKKERQLLIFVTFHGYDNQEIADIYDCSKQNVSRHLSNGYKKMIRNNMFERSSDTKETRQRAVEAIKNILN